MLIQVASESLRGMPASHRTTSGLEWITDEPQAMGGDNTGPNPLEAVLGAWAGCLVIVTRMVAAENGWTVGTVTTDTRGEFDPRGFMGHPGVSPYFSEAAAVLSVQGATDAQLVTLGQAVEARCPVSGLLKAAGIATRVTLQHG